MVDAHTQPSNDGAFASGGPDLADVVVGLFSRAESNLTDQDLVRLRNCSNEAQAILGGLSTLCAGVASLIGSDETSGALQTKQEVAHLLFAVAGISTHASALMAVATAAETRLQLRAERRTTRGEQVSHA